MGIREADVDRSRVLAVVASTASAAVILMAVLATLMIATAGSELWRVPFKMICHGQVDRAFAVAGTAMPLCARCTGIYAGIILGSIGVFLAPPRRRSRWLFVVGALIAAPMVIDGLMQTFGIWSTGNLPRAATGLFFGLGVVALAANGLAGTSPAFPKVGGKPTLGEPDVVER